MPEQHGGLWPNEPNPFRPGTDIRFALARAEHVLLIVYDIAGRRVRTLIDGALPERGDHHVHWDGADDHGQRMPAGIYIARLRTPTLNDAHKMTLLQ
jgi:flagellar hook assembly protein FlgD